MAAQHEWSNAGGNKESKTKAGEKKKEKRLLTISVVKDNDASLFGFCLLWIDHGGTNHKIH